MDEEMATDFEKEEQQRDKFFTQKSGREGFHFGRKARTFYAHFASIKIADNTTVISALNYLARAGDFEEKDKDLEHLAGLPDIVEIGADAIDRGARIRVGPTAERVLIKQTIELPKELDAEGRAAVADAIVKDWQQRGHQAVAAVHGNGRVQPHVHVAVTARPVKLVDSNSDLDWDPTTLRAESQHFIKLIKTAQKMNMSIEISITNKRPIKFDGIEVDRDPSKRLMVDKVAIRDERQHVADLINQVCEKRSTEAPVFFGGRDAEMDEPGIVGRPPKRRIPERAWHVQNQRDRDPAAIEAARVRAEHQRQINTEAAKARKKEKQAKITERAKRHGFVDSATFDAAVTKARQEPRPLTTAQRAIFEDRGIPLPADIDTNGAAQSVAWETFRAQNRAALKWEALGELGDLEESSLLSAEQLQARRESITALEKLPADQGINKTKGGSNKAGSFIVLAEPADEGQKRAVRTILSQISDVQYDRERDRYIVDPKSPAARELQKRLGAEQVRPGLTLAVPTGEEDLVASLGAERDPAQGKWTIPKDHPIPSLFDAWQGASATLAVAGDTKTEMPNRVLAFLEGSQPQTQILSKTMPETTEAVTEMTSDLNKALIRSRKDGAEQVLAPDAPLHERVTAGIAGREAIKVKRQLDDLRRKARQKAPEPQQRPRDPQGTKEAQRTTQEPSRPSPRPRSPSRRDDGLEM
tara:strand:- start:909 stop:3005 length:2097 start_codon:yes stop_codon:yes gene_type:complete